MSRPLCSTSLRCTVSSSRRSGVPVLAVGEPGTALLTIMPSIKCLRRREHTSLGFNQKEVRFARSTIRAVLFAMQGRSHSRCKGFFVVAIPRSINRWFQFELKRISGFQSARRRAFGISIYCLTIILLENSSYLTLCGLFAGMCFVGM